MSGNPIYSFNGLHPYDLRRFEAISRTITFKKGQKIFLKDEPFAWMVVVISGIVKLSEVKDDEEVITKYVKPMQFTGESYPDNSQTYNCSAHFMSDGVAMLINYKLFKGLIPWSPKTSLGMMKVLTKTQQSICQELENQRVFNSTQKVISFLLNYPYIVPQLMYKEMAAILFITPETFSREMKKLEDRECLTIRDGVIELNNRELERLLWQLF